MSQQEGTAATPVAPPGAVPTPDRMARAAAALLVTVAVGVLAAWTVAGPVGPWSPVTFGVFTGAGVAARFVRPNHRSGQQVQLALLFVGAVTLLLPGAPAVWAAAVVGAAAIARGDRARRLIASVTTLVISAGTASWALQLAEQAIGDQPAVVSASLRDRPLGVTTALLAAAALTLSWQLLRMFGSYLDRRGAATVLRQGSRWLLDVALAAGAAVAAVAWTVHPPLLLVVLIPVLVAWWFLDGAPLRGTLDDTTGVGTAAMLRVTLAEELSRAGSFDRPVAVVVVDVDDLARINATYGFEAGDIVMFEVADRVRDVARDYDVVARVGSDAIALLLPETDTTGAIHVAERVRDGVRGVPIELPTAERPITVRVSVGVASYPADASDRESLLTEAELAAAYAGVQGGDRIVSADRLPGGFRPLAAPTPRPVAPTEPELAGLSPVVDPLEGDRLVRAASEPLADARPATDRLLAVAVTLATIAAITGLIADPGIGDLARVTMFAGLAIGAEWFAESIYGRANASWAAVPLLALATAPATADTCGGLSCRTTATGVVVAAVLAAVGGALLRAIRIRQGLFNGAVLVLSTLAAYGVASALHGLGFEGALHTAALVGVAAGAAFFLVDTWLVAAAVALNGRSSVLDVWREDLLWLVPHQLGMGLLGGAMAFGWVRFEVPGTLLLVVPAIGLHLGQRQFIRRTRDHVMRLRDLNDDMHDANQRVTRVNERLTEALEQVNEGYLVTVESLAAAVDAKDSYTGSHIDRVEAYGKRLLQVLDPELAEDEALLWGFRLHDVGKIGVPDRVLLKPGPLDDDEWELMRRHPEIGAQIVAAAPFLQGARDVILHHHERWDGRGYPGGLAGRSIPFTARLFTVIDAFDAMTSDRPYRPGMPVDAAIRELVRNAGTQFDPEMIEAFLQVDQGELDRVRLEIEHARSDGRTRAGHRLIPIAPEFPGGALLERA